MKKLKVVLASLLLVAATIGISSKSEAFNKNGFATVCFLYSGPPNFTQANYTNVNNWISSTQLEVTSDCVSRNFLCAICFDNTRYATLSAALTASQSITPSTLPTTNGGQFGTTGVSIWQKPS